jgi:hypothetical protein
MVAAISAKANAQDRVAITRSGSMPLILHGWGFDWGAKFLPRVSAATKALRAADLNFSQPERCALRAASFAAPLFFTGEVRETAP